MGSSDGPRTAKREDRCPHCGKWHTFEVVTEPGWEAVVYCDRTGVVG
jgi:uncharacterized Zn finger protein